MAEKLKAAAGSFERLRLNSIDGELKSVNTKIDALRNEFRSEIKVVDTRVTEMDKRLSTRVEEMDKRLSTRVEEMDKRLSSKLEDMDRKLDIDRRMTMIEAKLKDLEKRS
jgi:DNA anti-recombination protein RmuC